MMEELDNIKANNICTDDFSYPILPGDNVIDMIAKHFKIFDVFDQNGKIPLARIGNHNDGGYVVPTKALITSNVILGYGAADDVSFEENYSKLTGNPSYVFDCGVKNINTNVSQLTFFDECIGSDKYINTDQNSSLKTSNFQNHIDRLNLSENNIFLKMDIEGAEYDAFLDIKNHFNHISGVVLELHYPPANLFKAYNLLTDLTNNFILVHAHGNNCCPGLMYDTKYSEGKIPGIIELTFINKFLVESYAPSNNQAHPTTLDAPNLKNRPDVFFTILTNKCK